MVKCHYGACKMRNLCRGEEVCVRKRLDDEGWELQWDGTLKKVRGQLTPVPEDYGEGDED